MTTKISELLKARPPRRHGRVGVAQLRNVGGRVRFWRPREAGAAAGSATPSSEGRKRIVARLPLHEYGHSAAMVVLRRTVNPAPSGEQWRFESSGAHNYRGLGLGRAPIDLSGRSDCESRLQGKVALRYVETDHSSRIVKANSGRSRASAIYGYPKYCDLCGGEGYHDPKCPNYGEETEDFRA